MRSGALSGALAGPVFVIAFLVQGALRAGYSSMRHPVSSLAIGEGGWAQSLNFMVAGVLLLFFALTILSGARLRRNETRWAPALVGVTGLGLIGAGLFTADPFNGYPPGTPNHPLTHSLQGTLHAAASICGFVAMAAACLADGWQSAKRREIRWAIYSAGSGAGSLAAYLLAAQAINQVEPFVAICGLLQRVAIVVGMAWVTSYAVRHLNTVARC